MSEIVRPTRDGIHGREYISTQVDIGRKPLSLSLTPDGKLVKAYPPLVEIPIPLIFNTMPWHTPSANVTAAILDAAKELGTFAVTDDPGFAGHEAAIPHGEAVSGARLVEWPDSPDVAQKVKQAKSANPDLLAIVKLQLGTNTVERSLELAAQGVDALHVYADWHGYDASGRHITLAVREVHQAFVRNRNRDEITLIASGGVSLAEHVAKTILCGADLVAVDVPLMIALECRVCRNCTDGLACPVGLAETDHDYAVQRMVNMVGAWHSQLLEMMGAMGIREARRLRGETGRAMFFDDLERDCFGPVFGKRMV